MNKKWPLFITIAILSAIIAIETVFAADSIKLILTGQEVSPFVPLRIVKVSSKNHSDIEKRLNLLEFALISQSPEEVANTWAKGVMSRNGALQYAVLCDNLQFKYKSDFETWGWWTGASSPWIDSYQISTGEQQLDGTWKFIITFHYTDSTKAAYSSVSNILVGAKNVDNAPLPVYPGTEQKWCVEMIETAQFLQKDTIMQSSN